MLIDSATIAAANPVQGREISDWSLQDDRQFNRTITGLIGAETISDVYLTFKKSPTDFDADALFQKHVTAALTVNGQIIGGNVVRIEVFTRDFANRANAGQVYSYDIRFITSTGRTYTIESGQVQFVQNTTQTSDAGTPGSPLFVDTAPGVAPRFRGWVGDLPLAGTGDRVGDFFMNISPVPGDWAGFVFTPSGWKGFGGIQYP